jgi:hypothetical protein
MTGIQAVNHRAALADSWKDPASVPSVLVSADGLIHSVTSNPRGGGGFKSARVPKNTLSDREQLEPKWHKSGKKTDPDSPLL